MEAQTDFSLNLTFLQQFNEFNICACCAAFWLKTIYGQEEMLLMILVEHRWLLRPFVRTTWQRHSSLTRRLSAWWHSERPIVFPQPETKAVINWCVPSVLIYCMCLASLREGTQAIRHSADINPPTSKWGPAEVLLLTNSGGTWGEGTFRVSVLLAPQINIC